LPTERLTPMAEHEDLNTIAITGLIMRPVDYAQQVIFVELKIVNGPAVTDIAAMCRRRCGGC
jgi:hypothetical protein